MQWDIFDPPNLSSAEAAPELADNFATHYKQVEVGQIRSAYDTVTTPEQVAHVLAPIRRHGQETMVALVTDSKGRILNFIRHTKGVKDGSTVDPLTLVASIANTDGAAQVWFGHNHPSGITSPSSADGRITGKLNETLEGSGIEVKGHIIVGHGASEYAMLDAEGNSPVAGEYQAINPDPGVRRQAIGVTERVIRKRNAKDQANVTGPGSLISYVRSLQSDSGIILMDNRHNTLGVIAMTPDEMARLRKGQRVNRILKAIDKSNAVAGAVFDRVGGNGASLINTSSYLQKVGVRVLDVIEHDGDKLASRMSAGRDIGSASRSFFSRGKDSRVESLVRAYAGVNGAPSEAEIREAVRQYREVEQTYAEVLRDHDQNGKPLPTPNGDPSNLNREQWVMVRTPNFKAWFGDWEASANIEWLDKGKPVAAMGGTEVPVFEKLGDLARWAGDHWASASGGKATHPVLGDVVLDKRAASASIGHGIGKIKAQGLYLVPDIVRHGRLLGQLPQTKGKPRAFLIAAPVEIGGKTYKGLVEVRQLQDMNRMYVHEFVLRESKDPAGEFNSAATSTKDNQLHGSRHGAIYSFVQGLREVKASRAVGENGEPQVVYHGTDADIAAFNTAALGINTGAASAKKGFFFSSSPRVAKFYPGYPRELLLRGLGFVRSDKEYRENPKEARRKVDQENVIQKGIDARE